MLSLASVLEFSARQHANRVAIVVDRRRWTYAEVDAAANRIARLLSSLGLRRGDRVALTCPNGAAFVAAHFGIIKAGMVSVPLNILLTESEIAYHLDDSNARAYLCHVDTAELALAATGSAGYAQARDCRSLVFIGPDARADVDGSRAEVASGVSAHPKFDGDDDFSSVQTNETDTAVVFYTSGTTGRPKGAELTHSNLVHNALIGCQNYDTRPDDVYLAAVPLSHAGGLTVLLHTAFAAGAALVLLPRYRPDDVLNVMRDEGVTVFLGVPTMYQTLLDVARSSPELTRTADEVVKTLRLCLIGAAAAPHSLLAEFESRFGIQLMEGYGLSETSPMAAVNRPGLPRRDGSVGKAVWGVEIGIRRIDGSDAECGETGEVTVRGHNVMKGYLNNPEASREAIDERGWFHTGDLGHLDADGYLTIVGRKKEMIIRGGFNIYPRELEELLLTHADVAQVAVVGVPHVIHGEEVLAFVVRTPESTLTEEDLMVWCRTTMAAYKYPRIIEFRDHLPLNAFGKVIKRELVATIAER